MKTVKIQPEKRKEPDEKAVAPMIGAAAFYDSTAFQTILAHTPFPSIFQHMLKKCAAIHNILKERHYFRPGLADGDVAIVVLTEGQGNPLGKLREVAV